MPNFKPKHGKVTATWLADPNKERPPLKASKANFNIFCNAPRVVSTEERRKQELKARHRLIEEAKLANAEKARLVEEARVTDAAKAAKQLKRS